MNKKKTEWILREKNLINLYSHKKYVYEELTKLTFKEIKPKFWERRRNLKWILRFKVLFPPYFLWVLFISLLTLAYFSYWIFNSWWNNNEENGGWKILTTEKNGNCSQCTKTLENSGAFSDEKPLFRAWKNEKRNLSLCDNCYSQTVNKPNMWVFEPKHLKCKNPKCKERFVGKMFNGKKIKEPEEKSKGAGFIQNGYQFLVFCIFCFYNIHPWKYIFLLQIHKFVYFFWKKWYKLVNFCSKLLISSTILNPFRGPFERVWFNLVEPEQEKCEICANNFNKQIKTYSKWYEHRTKGTKICSKCYFSKEEKIKKLRLTVFTTIFVFIASIATILTFILTFVLI